MKSRFAAILLLFSTALIGTLAPLRALAVTPPLPDSCTSAFHQLNAQLGQYAITDTYEQTRELKQPTVEEIGEEEGIHGGKRILLRRTGPRWGSFATTVNYDPQGDPRWMIELLGEEAAAWFGYRMIDEERMTVPDHAEFTAALAKVNARLEAEGAEPSAITFYPTVDNNNVSVRDYTDRFIAELGIPIAHSGNHRLHDLSFHTPAVFIPRFALEYMAGKLAYHRELLRFLAERYADASPAAQAAVRYYSYLLRMQDTVAIDSATGRVGIAIVSYLHDLKEKEAGRGSPYFGEPDGRIAGSMHRILDPYYAPEEEALLTRLDLETEFDPEARERPPGKSAATEFGDPSKIARHERTIPRAQLRQDILDFIAQFDPARTPLPYGFDPKSTQHERDVFHGTWVDPRFSSATLCTQITWRRMLIRDAALRIASEEAAGAPPAARPH